MTTEFYKIGSGCDADVLERAGELIRSGELVAFPTETVYGLGANAYLAESARKVYAAKGRPSDNPLIVHVNDSADASLFAETNETYKKLAKQFMPGPLTVILPKKDVIPDEVTGRAPHRCGALPFESDRTRADTPLRRADRRSECKSLGKTLSDLCRTRHAGHGRADRPW